VENAQNSKTPIHVLADKIAKYFVPSIIILALGTMIFWYILAGTEYGNELLATAG
jgi:Cu+-exporting ATPase